MKKVILFATLISRTMNRFGNYAYRVSKVTDEKGKELDLDDFKGLKEQEDGSYTMWSLNKVGKYMKPAKLDGVLTDSGYINIEDANANARLEALDEQLRGDGDLVRRIGHISRLAERNGMGEKGTEILIGTVSQTLFAGIGQPVKRSAAVFNIADDEETEETPKTDPKQLSNEQPQEQTNLKAEPPLEGATEGATELKKKD